ncbi:MAG: helix-turn-helix domain-containing protein [Prevotellaceae bacterium]|nr:helix-turn-helix domain-containing protein [Prevotellaceae bacterium]
MATSVLAFNAIKMSKTNAEQLGRQRLLSLSFGSICVFYFSCLAVSVFIPHTIAEGNVVSNYLLLSISVFPILLYLFNMATGRSYRIRRVNYVVIISLLLCLIAFNVTKLVTNNGWFSTHTEYGVGATIWLLQSYFLVRFLLKIERLCKKSEQTDRRIRIYAYLFLFVWFSAIPLLFLHSKTIYWIFLQLLMWSCHISLFFFIIRKDYIVAYPLHNQTKTLNDPYYIFNQEDDDSMYGSLYERLVSFFEREKPYLQPGINVADVATRVFSNKTYLSRLLNDKLNQNFNQFVNSFRIREAQQVVTEYGAMPLSKLCKKVGFTSMATFTVAFKINTGMTPGEWCKNQTRNPH